MKTFWLESISKISYKLEQPVLTVRKVKKLIIIVKRYNTSKSNITNFKNIISNPVNVIEVKNRDIFIWRLFGVFIANYNPFHANIQFLYLLKT